MNALAAPLARARLFVLILLTLAACARSVSVDGGGDIPENCVWQRAVAFADSPFVVGETPGVASVADDGTAFYVASLEHDESAYGFHVYHVSARGELLGAYAVADYLPRAVRSRGDALALVGVDTLGGDCVFRELDAGGNEIKRFTLFTANPEACRVGRVAISDGFVGLLYGPDYPHFAIESFQTFDIGAGDGSHTTVPTTTVQSSKQQILPANDEGFVLDLWTPTTVTLADLSGGGDLTERFSWTVSDNVTSYNSAWVATAHRDGILGEVAFEAAVRIVSPGRIVTLVPPVELPIRPEYESDIVAVSTDTRINVLVPREQSLSMWSLDRGTREASETELGVAPQYSNVALAGSAHHAYAFWSSEAKLYVSTFTCR